MEENAVAARTGTVGGESVLAAAKTMRAEAERQFAESGRILTGLHAASERFRRDLAAFSSSMQSLAKNQLSAAERFGEDAQRFLSEMDAFSATDTEADRADGEEDGDIFGFTSAAAMIGDLLKDLPEESGVSEEGGAAAPDPAEGKPAADDTDILLAESALSGQVEEEAGRLLAQLLDMGEIGTENAGVSVNDAETDGGGERAENGNPPALSGEAVPDSTAASSPGEAGSDEGGAESSDGSEEDHEEAAGEDPGDEELAAVMAALSGISEDDSYDAMLAAFQPDEEVDTGLAKHLAKKRRENFRRMMEEAAKALAGESSPAGDGAEKAPASDMSFVSEGSDDAGLEEELTAAVEAAIRADLDPEKALDEMFAALTEGSEDGGTAGSGVPTGALSGEEPGEDPLSTDMLELIDFDAPAEDSPAYTDHSLEEFVSSRSDGSRSDGGRSDGEPPRGEDAG